MSEWRVSMVFRPAAGAGTFTAGSLYGWTETYYHVEATRGVVEAHADQLLTVRLPMLTRGWRVSKMRFAQLPNTRIAFSVNQTPESGRGTYAISPTVTDEQPYDKLLLNILCTSGGNRTFTLGGIGSDVVDPGGIYMAPGAFTAALAGYNVQLGNGWAVRRATRGAVKPLGGVVASPTVGYVGNAITPQLVSQFASAAYPAGTVLRVSGVVGLAYLNGTWRVSSDPGVGGFSTPVLQAKRGVRIYGSWVGGGSMWAYTYSMDPMISATASRGSSRRTGGPSDRPRGRRSIRRS